MKLRIRYRPSCWALGLLLGLFSSLASALEVVTTTTSLGMLAREIGNDRVTVTTLGPPDRDIHYLQAKPSMILALRRADLLVLVGADLEVGWLPAALGSSTNGAIQPGSAGHFEAAAHTSLIGQSSADRSLGDVHPQGNPHFGLDPVRMADIAMALAQRMGALDKANADFYSNNARQLAASLQQLSEQLQTLTVGAPGALLMHKSADYLMARLQIPVLGYMEPVPGIPPTAAHIRTLSETLKGKQGVIIHAPYHQDQAARSLATALNWARFVLPIEPPRQARFMEYKALMLRWAEALNPST
ncbi:MAG: metal ABC transporter substrate-binding protein [Ketobacteraceae bacterium]|nr:metal ABC transporter substrate-binding protein [Ketobacteraceae bacterium]